MQIYKPYGLNWSNKIILFEIDKQRCSNLWSAKRHSILLQISSQLLFICPWVGGGGAGVLHFPDGSIKSNAATSPQLQG